MNENEIQALIARSEDLGEQGEHEEAVEILSDALCRQQDDRLFFERGQHHFFLDHPQIAIHDFTDAIDINPTNARYYFWRGSVYWDDLNRSTYGDDDRLNGLPDLLRSIQLDPKLFSPYIMIGICLLDFQLPQDGLYFAERACELDLESEEAHHVRGMCLQRVKRVDEAIEEFKIALDINPDRAGTWKSLGSCYESRGDKAALTKANDCFRRAVKIEPCSLWYQFMLGDSLIKLERYAEAIDVLVPILDSDPEAGERILTEAALRKAEERLRRKKLI